MVWSARPNRAHNVSPVAKHTSSRLERSDMLPPPTLFIRSLFAELIGHRREKANGVTTMLSALTSSPSSWLSRQRRSQKLQCTIQHHSFNASCFNTSFGFLPFLSLSLSLHRPRVCTEIELSSASLLPPPRRTLCLSTGGCFRLNSNDAPRPRQALRKQTGTMQS